MPVARETLAKLCAVPAPESDAATVKRIYDAATGATDTFERASSDRRRAQHVLDT